MRFFKFILLSTFILSASQIAMAETLPIKRVVLSTSGMGHFEHEGKISGDKHLELPVRLQQVDDLLKSLVVFDQKGQVSSVTLPGQQPLGQVFRDLPFQQSALKSPVKLLNAYQGTGIKISGTVNAEGKLIQVVPEKSGFMGFSKDENKKPMIKRHRISLMTKNGIKHAVFEELDSVQFTDPKVKSEIDKALLAVRENSTQDIRTLDIFLKGKDNRYVSLAYVVDAPLWKATYRYVMPKAGQKEGFLQGWAVLENMTSQDWDNVDLTLVSGNPVTYRQSLYQSYHVSRPALPVEVLGRVMPRVDTGSLATADIIEADFELAEEKVMRDQSYRGRKAKKSPQKSMAFSDGLALAPAMAMEQAYGGAGSMAHMANAAQSSDATTQVLFSFPDKVSLTSGQSMMVPFVSQKTKLERLSLYQPDTHAKYPLAAVKFKNNGKSGLPPGILTLYEENNSGKGTSFVGDAQMPVLGKGEERLISYALDSKTTINREMKSPQTEGMITASQGVMRTSIKYRSETSYTIKAPASEDRIVMLEHRKMHDYKLISPSPKEAEVTDTHYRIKVPVKAGETKVTKVILERDGWQSIRISNISLYDLKAYATSRGKLNKQTRRAFEKMARMRQGIDNIESQLRDLNNKKQLIYNDQNRIRQNIKALSGKSDLKNRYLKQLDGQEDKLEDIEEGWQELNNEKNKRQREFNEFIANLKF